MNLHYVLPDDDYGTAGAVKKAQPYLDEPFFIVSGDLVTDFDLKEIADFHEKKKSKLTITLTSVENPLQFGVVITDPNGKIQKFLEKPSWGEVFSDTINTGIYILEPEILDLHPRKRKLRLRQTALPQNDGRRRSRSGAAPSRATGATSATPNPTATRTKRSWPAKSNCPSRAKRSKKANGTHLPRQRDQNPQRPRSRRDVILGKNVKLGAEVKLKNCRHRLRQPRSKKVHHQRQRALGKVWSVSAAVSTTPSSATTTNLSAKSVHQRGGDHRRKL